MSAGLLGGSEGYGRGYRRIVVLLIWLVTVPSGVLLAVGITMLALYHWAPINLVFGILVLTLVGCLVTGAVLALVFLRREAKLSKLQSDFVSKVSHELRTPLTSIRLFVETLQLKRTTNPEDVDACLQVLARETQRLTERIERLLDWGRMEAGRRVYDRRPDEPDAVVAEALRAFEASTIGRDVPVKLEADAELPTVLADRAAIVDALVNLLTNAYKYSGEDRRITLTAHADDKWLRLGVRDNGIGIPLGEHRRIFEKFYRVDERLSRAVEGSGLGLAIVRHVANAHGGRIEVESEPGKGSTFTIKLPRPAPKALAAARARAIGATA